MVELEQLLKERESEINVYKTEHARTLNNLKNNVNNTIY